MGALKLRVEKLERGAVARLAANADDLAAQKAAGELGFDVELFVMTQRRGNRVRMAQVLNQKGWSAERIGRVLRCSEKTIRRWLSGHGER